MKVLITGGMGVIGAETSRKFVAEGHRQTFGEMEPASKYAISHRTRAFDHFKQACLDAGG